jgi:tetratricopeptide (TPR) repeat protein
VTHEPQSETEPIRPIDVVKALILEGRFDKALTLLGSIPVTFQNETEILFLRGRIAEAQGLLQMAVDYYREILRKRPELVRVRLELARVLFLLKNDDAARYHFELALGHDPPPAVRANIERFLDIIRRRRHVKFGFSFSVVPDTNINAATDDSQVTLFGLPFQLSEDAQRQSGIGLAFSGNADLSQPLDRNYKFETGVWARHVEYEVKQFDDTRLRGYAGLRFVHDSGDVMLRALGARRWFGNDGYNHSVGGLLGVGQRIVPRLHLGLAMSGERINYDKADFLDGGRITGQGKITYAVSSQSSADLFAGATREITEDPAYTNTAPFIGVSFYSDLPLGLGLRIGPQFTHRQFDEPFAAFGVTRLDRIITVGTEIKYRKDLIFGFAPLLTYTYTKNYSNISIFEYQRHQVEFGFTREF